MVWDVLMSMFDWSACCGVLFVDVPLLVSSMSMSSRSVGSCCFVLVFVEVPSPSSLFFSVTLEWFRAVVFFVCMSLSSLLLSVPCCSVVRYSCVFCNVFG